MEDKNYTYNLVRAHTSPLRQGPLTSRTRDLPSSQANKVVGPTDNQKLCLVILNHMYFVDIFRHAQKNYEKRLSALSVCLSVEQSARNDSAATGQICIKFDIYFFNLISNRNNTYPLS